MRLTINIDITDKKALALLNYIKTLDFVDINENEDTPEYALTNDQISILKDRKQKHLNGESKSYSWEEIKKEFKA